MDIAPRAVGECGWSAADSGSRAEVADGPRLTAADRV